MSRTESFVPALAFDWLTPLYDPIVRVTSRETAFKSRLLAQAAPGPSERILDLGCGTGTLALEVKHRQPEADVLGLDADPSVVSRARTKAKDAGLAVRFEKGRADDLPFPDQSFDKVLSTLFFHHLDRATRERTAGEIFRVLRPGGELHVADWGQPRGLLGSALFLSVRLLDGFEQTADNAKGRLPELFSAAELDTRRRGRLQTAVGTVAFFSATRPRAD